jgi:hypothetical protein
MLGNWGDWIHEELILSVPLFLAINVGFSRSGIHETMTKWCSSCFLGLGLRWWCQEQSPEDPCSKDGTNKGAYPVHIELLPSVVTIVDICPAKCLWNNIRTISISSRKTGKLECLLYYKVLKRWPVAVPNPAYPVLTANSEITSDQNKQFEIFCQYYSYILLFGN